jgi:flagellar secretion chaperone FliS
MDPYFAYRQPYSPGWTRADMLLALFDGAIERLELAAGALKRGERITALRLLTRAELLVCELASGVDPDYDYATDFSRLYTIVSSAISTATAEQTEIAVHALRTMRSMIAGIRDEAARLEREGTLPPAGAANLVHATA